MPRVRIEPEQLAKIQAEIDASKGPKLFDIDQFAAARKERKKVKRRNFSDQAERWLRETNELIRRAKEEGGEVWIGVKPENLVALYAAMHEAVYGVLPHELAAEFPAAVSAATRMLREEFSGDTVTFVDFVRHVFIDARRAESRRKEGSGSWRVQWRHLFMFGGAQSLKLLTDYRIALKRKEAKRG